MALKTSKTGMAKGRGGAGANGRKGQAGNTGKRVATEPSADTAGPVRKSPASNRGKRGGAVAPRRKG